MTKAETLEIKRIAEKYGLKHEEVTKIVKAQYQFIYKTLKEMDLPRNLTEEEFRKVTKNFNIPAIGKLHSSWAAYKKLNKL